MKVLDLQCEAGHGFEGWFGSESDYLDQRSRGLVSCPVCGSGSVRRLPSAPRLNLSHGERRRPESQDPAATPASVKTVTPASSRPSPDARVAMEAAYLQAVRHVLANTEDVGTRFAEEARRIHHGEAEDRRIRGRTSPEEARALADEGIEVMSLPIPAGLDGPLQ